MAKTTGRVIALEYSYTGEHVSATRLYFDNGEELLLSGHILLLNGATLDFRYKRNDPPPHTLNKIVLLSG